jgi:nucleotide-binding universal stress UspA family protein
MYVLSPLPDPADLVYIGHIGRSEWAPLMLSSHELEQAVAQQAETEERAGRQLLSHTVEKLKAAGLTAASVLTRGDAATEIFQYHQTHPIDLIVAGSRGLGAVTGWWLGSVSRKLVHYANCSVLIVKSGPSG